MLVSCLQIGNIGRTIVNGLYVDTSTNHGARLRRLCSPREGEVKKKKDTHQPLWWEIDNSKIPNTDTATLQGANPRMSHNEQLNR